MEQIPQGYNASPVAWRIYIKTEAELGAGCMLRAGPLGPTTGIWGLRTSSGHGFGSSWGTTGRSCSELSFEWDDLWGRANETPWVEVSKPRALWGVSRAASGPQRCSQQLQLSSAVGQH